MATRRSATKTRAARPGAYAQRLEEIALFFQKRDKVHQTMRRTIMRLEKKGVAYAILGGMALNAHGYERTTKDVDLLLTPDGLDEFRTAFVGKDYEPVAGRPRRFVEKASGVTIDILVTGRYPGSGKPGPIAFPHPESVRERIEHFYVVNLPTLIELKLAARRWRDFADVVELIRANDLGDSFARKLHPSVHKDFVECLEEKRREDEYESRAD